ncbi:lipoyl synthase, partial [Staphylococcus arlettae]
DGPLVRSSYHADEQVNEAAKEKHRLGEEQLKAEQ